MNDNRVPANLKWFSTPDLQRHLSLMPLLLALLFCTCSWVLCQPGNPGLRGLKRESFKAANQTAPVKVPLTAAPAQAANIPTPLPAGGADSFQNDDGNELQQYRLWVERYAERFQINPQLVWAIIKAESNFDPLAVSRASAYGLMQVVPSSGGRDAYRMVYGRDLTPSREYLHDPEKNIELGTAYLSLLGQKFFAAVEDPVSREYCQIAAYNTGPKRVLRTFGFDYEHAVQKINSLAPSQVLDHLKRHLPYRETRRYLPKVVNFRRELANT